MHHLPELNDGRLYDLLEAGGEQARASARLLARFLEEGGKSAANLAEPVQRSAKIADELRAHLEHAIMSSLPKADVEAVCLAIAGIPTAAERFASRFELAAGNLGGVDFRPPLNWIEELIEIVLDMVHQLRGFESVYRIKDLYPRLETVADRAEDLIEGIVNRGYQEPAPPLGVIMVKDLADHMIEIVDRCREAGRLMNTISAHFL